MQSVIKWHVCAFLSAVDWTVLMWCIDIDLIIYADFATDVRIQGLLLGRPRQKSLWLLCFTSDRGEIWHSCSSSKYTSIYRVGFSIWLILSRWWSGRHFTQKSAATWWSAGGASARRLCSSSIQYSFNEKLTERKFLIYSTFYTCFLARDSIYAIARYMPSPVRPSVCLSVRPSVCPSHGWISQRRLKLGSRNLHHRVAPWL